MRFFEGFPGVDVPGTEGSDEELARLGVVGPVQVGKLAGVAEGQCNVITAYFDCRTILDETDDRMCQCRRDGRVGAQG